MAASAHPFDTGSSAFQPDLPEVFGEGMRAAPSTFVGSPPTSYDTTDNMRFLGFSARPATGSLSEANSDIAFQETVAWQGSFKGFRRSTSAIRETRVRSSTSRTAPAPPARVTSSSTGTS